MKLSDRRKKTQEKLKEVKEAKQTIMLAGRYEVNTGGIGKGVSSIVM
jgi:hypothetical protein